MTRHTDSGDPATDAGNPPTDRDVQDDDPVRTDGGTADAAAEEEAVDYLETEINLLKPTTPFMRDHLKVVWTGFIIWAIVVFVPPTVTFIAPDAMSSQMPVLGFPLHYFLIAVGGPTGALILSFWYTRKRDALDEKYGIDHSTTPDTGDGDDAEGAAATDGGVSE